MNNTTNNQNGDLESYSLGSMNTVNSGENVAPVEPISPVAPVAPVAPEPMAPIENLDATDVNSTPNFNVAQTPINEPVTPPPSYEIPEPINNFETPVLNNIGSVPPAGVENEGALEPPSEQPEPKKKKGINKTTFVVIIILALVIVASVIYVLLNQAKTKKSTVTLKDVSIEAGSVVSTDINDYATFSNIDTNSCTLDTSSINTENYNKEYVFTITCNGINYSGKAKIVDTTLPVVEVQDVNTGVNKEVKPEDFIASCEDLTTCTYTFKDSDKVKENLTTSGKYKVDIIVKDAAGNEVEVTSNLIVSDTYAEYYLVVSREINGYTEKTKLGIEDNLFNKVAIRTITFDFSDNETEYTKLKEESKNNDKLTYKSITGVPEFNDEDKTLTFTSTITYDELNEELNTTLPLAMGEIKNYFKDLGYTYKFES